MCGSGSQSKSGAVISIYALPSGRSEEDKDSFYYDLSTKMQSKDGNYKLDRWI